MLSALGHLNANLLAAQYGPGMQPDKKVEQLIRESKGLEQHAKHNYMVAMQQYDHTEESIQTMILAFIMNRIVRHTRALNSLCTGPCYRVPYAKINQLRALANAVRDDTSRADAVSTLADEIRGLADTPSTDINIDVDTDIVRLAARPRFCTLTGLPCAIIRIDTSRKYQGLDTQIRELRDAAHTRVSRAHRVLEEAQTTRELAQSVGRTYVREIEARERYNATPVHDDAVIRGGSRNTKSFSRNKIVRFFEDYELGDVPVHATSIREALTSAVAQFPERSRKSITTDLLYRWASYVEH